MTAPAIKQFVIVDPAEVAVNESQSLGRVAFVDAEGNPADLGGGDAAVAWADVTGKPSTFTPAAHTHEIAEVTGLQDAIDALDARVTALEGAGA